MQNYTGSYASGLGTVVELSEKQGELFFQQFEGDERQPRFKRPVRVAFIDRSAASLQTGNVIDDRTTLHFTRPNETGVMGYMQFGFQQLVRKR